MFFKLNKTGLQARCSFRVLTPSPWSNILPELERDFLKRPRFCCEAYSELGVVVPIFCSVSWEQRQKDLHEFQAASAA